MTPGPGIITWMSYIKDVPMVMVLLFYFSRCRLSWLTRSASGLRPRTDNQNLFHWWVTKIGAQELPHQPSVPSHGKGKSLNYMLVRAKTVSIVRIFKACHPYLRHTGSGVKVGRTMCNRHYLCKCLRGNSTCWLNGRMTTFWIKNDVHFWWKWSILRYLPQALWGYLHSVFHLV